MNKIHGSSNTIHVLRTKTRVLFVFRSLKNETPLVFSILGTAVGRLLCLPTWRLVRREWWDCPWLWFGRQLRHDPSCRRRDWWEGCDLRLLCFPASGRVRVKRHQGVTARGASTCRAFSATCVLTFLLDRFPVFVLWLKNTRCTWSCVITELGELQFQRSLSWSNHTRWARYVWREGHQALGS